MSCLKTITAKDRKDVVDDSCCKVVKLILVFFTALNQYTLVTCFMNTTSVMVGHHYARRRRARDIRRDAERAARATDEAEDTDVASG